MKNRAKIGKAMTKEIQQKCNLNPHSIRWNLLKLHLLLLHSSSDIKKQSDLGSVKQDRKWIIVLINLISHLSSATLPKQISAVEIYSEFRTI